MTPAPRGWLILRARWQRHWHCLFGMFSNHMELTFRDERRRIVLIGCACGEVFYDDPDGVWKVGQP